MVRYEHVSGAVFALIALAQLTRALRGLPAHVGTLTIPVWWSFLAFAVTTGLAVWAFRTAKGRRLTSA